MGFTKAALKLMVDDFNRRGVRPRGKLLTLGRHEMCFDKEYFDRICQYSGWGIGINNDDSRSHLINDEVVFKTLGFESVDSMDYSEYEGASIVHDLNNTDISDELINKFDYIFDGGTSEHIFNFPHVLENVFKMLKIGGGVYFELPIMHMINHGYYNFSPCLLRDYYSCNKWQVNTLTPYSIRNGNYYTFDTVINDIEDVSPLPDNNWFRNMVFGSVTKTSQSTFSAIPYQGRYSKEWEKNKNAIIWDAFKVADSKSLFLYGTGLYLRYLVTMLPERYRNKIAGLISNDKNETGTYLYGYYIYELNEIKEKCKTILIATTDQYQDVVYQRIRHLEHDGVKIICLKGSD